MKPRASLSEWREIGFMRLAELRRGVTIAVAANEQGITNKPYDRVRLAYCGVKVDKARRPMESEAKHARLKREQIKQVSHSFRCELV